jgi:hypothetical protein
MLQRIGAWIIIGGLGVPLWAGTVFMDQFQAWQSRLNIGYEHPLTTQERLYYTLNYFLFSGDIDVSGWMYGVAYRRFPHTKIPQLFYYFGIRTGNMTIRDMNTTEKQSMIVPFYGVGLTSTLSQRWFHTLSIEVTHTWLYTDRVNTDELLKIGIIPSFAFGYYL